MKRFLLSIMAVISSVGLLSAEENELTPVVESNGEAMAVSQDVSDLGDLVAKAELAYQQGDYDFAIRQYEQLVTIFNGAPDIHYSLGNCYYKSKEYARAILNYERCLKKDPDNEDAQVNLEMAKAMCVDKVEVVQPVIFVAWNEAIRDSLTVDGWSKLSIGCFLLALVGVACFFFVRKISVRKTGFYGAIFMLVFFVVSLLYAHSRNDKILSHDDAIVTAPSVAFRSEPKESGYELSTIHEGIKVHIRQEMNGWTEVELPDGTVGWIRDDQFEAI